MTYSLVSHFNKVCSHIVQFQFLSFLIFHVARVFYFYYLWIILLLCYYKFSLCFTWGIAITSHLFSATSLKLKKKKICLSVYLIYITLLTCLKAFDYAIDQQFLNYCHWTSSVNIFWNLLEMQIPRPHPKPSDSEIHVLCILPVILIYPTVWELLP